MKKIFVLFVVYFITLNVSGQFTTHDLLELAAQPSKNIAHFMSKNGFIPADAENDSMISFIQKIKRGKTDTTAKQNICLYEKNGSKYFVLHTISLSQYLDGQQSLIRSGFICDSKKDKAKDSLIIYQKANMSVEASKSIKDSVTEYQFELRQRKIPDSILYAEDLLQFDSHEFLVSYFGKKNISEDLYFFSEKDLKKCSVLFFGTDHQAVFVWGDETNLNNLSYIHLSNVIPTKKTEERGVPNADNAWKFHSGLHLGMSLKEMLRMNEMDFYIYGNKSEFALMIKPEVTGKIDFKKTAIMLNCTNCAGNEIFDQTEISALDLAKANQTLSIFDIILYP